MSDLFADIILPLSLPRLYTYSVPAEFRDVVHPGIRVVVQLGRHKMYAGLVHKVHAVPPQAYEVKPIAGVLDEEPVVLPRQLSHWEWMAGYYMANLGEVMNVALPSALKLQSETRILLNEEFDHVHERLTDDEYLLYEALLGRSHLTLAEAAKILQVKSAHRVLKGLIEKGAVLMEEEIREKYRPKTARFLSLAPGYATDEALLKALFSSLEKRSPRQLEAVMTFMKLHYEGQREEWIARNEVVAASPGNSAAVQALVKKGIFIERSQVRDRLASYDGKANPSPQLTPAQQQCRDDIRTAFEAHDTVLLHGVTSSGKTEIYLHLISEALALGKQVLYLLPEIALTAQMINRLRRVLGDRVDVYHSRFSLNERAEVWKRVLRKDPRSSVILGARSSMFLPFSDLGLVLIDEEHDASFKQSDPAPRYNARDASLVLAKIHGAKTLLGTATPGMETYQNALDGKYGLVTLSERFGGLHLPSIRLVDTGEAMRKKIMKSHFSPDLLEAMKEALEHKEQVILFQNRRGFAPIIECNRCAWTPHCRNCSVTLTFHKQYNLLKCHYCGYSTALPALCEACGSPHLELRGMGTEKIEEEMALFFPSAHVARMDLDTVRSRNSYIDILTQFEDRRIDVLVGTQMITKGLDFDNVSLVGIINADQLLNFPDFRAFERSFQLLQQVSGRSGRKQRQGRVIIQTRQPQHWVLQEVVSNNFQGWYAREVEERRRFAYPPFTRLIEIHVRHKNHLKVNDAAVQLADIFRQQLGQRVLGPHDPLIRKVRNYWLKTILVKIEKDISPQKVKEILQQGCNTFYAEKENRSVLVMPDVDPL